MGYGAITEYVDWAQVVLYVFWVFFAGLVVYLVRENKREGYPLVNADGRVTDGWPPRPRPKTYLFEDGSTVQKPDDNDFISPRQLLAEPVHRYAGAPLEPVGNPMLAGVGPGAWAERADSPELTNDGHPKMVPVRTLPDHAIKGRDPRGLPVIGCDGEVAGTLVDVWMDTSEFVVRFVEVSVPAAGRNVLMPSLFMRVGRDAVTVDAITAAQFADVPATRSPQEVTMLEEEKIMAYFGAGTLYATPGRAEPLL